MERALVTGICLSIATTVAAGPVWIETFDAGVGRFSNTAGLGASRFVWNSATQQIDGEFERTTSGRADRRYADLGRTLTHNDSFGFSMVFTPNSISPQLHAAANIGFWDSTQSVMTTWVGVRIGKPAGILISGTDENGGPIGLGNNSPFVAFSFGTTYFIEFASDGNGLLSLGVFQGRNNAGTILGSTQWTLQMDETFSVDALGFGNPGQGSTTFWASIDDVSYSEPAVIPLPSAACLCVVALGIPSMRRRRVAFV